MAKVDKIATRNIFFEIAGAGDEAHYSGASIDFFALSLNFSVWFLFKKLLF